MQTDVRLPPRDPELAPTSAPPRRWRRRVVVTVLVLFAGALAFGGLFLSNYDPICQEQCTGVSGVVGPGVTDLGDMASPKGESFEAYRVDRIPGRKFSFWFTLSNEDHIPVTVTHIGDPPHPWGPYVVASVRTQSMGKGTTEQGLAVFHPFVLGHSDFVNVLVTMQVRTCNPGQGPMWVGSVPVTFTVLGVTRHATVYPPTSIELALPTHNACQG